MILKKFKSSIRFDNANKIDNYNEGLRWGGKEKKKKKKKIQKKLQNKSKHKNNKYFKSLLSESFPSVRITSPP